MRRPSVIPRHEDSNGWWNIQPEPMPAKVAKGEIRVETAVVGAGICGLSVARQLGHLRPNDQIAVIEAERAGFGASGRNAGFMLNLHSHGPPKQLNILKRNMKLWESGLSDLRRIVREHQIRCDWDDFGRIYGAAGPDGETHIDEIAETLNRLGLEHRWMDQAEMQHRTGTGFYRRGLYAAGNALVNPSALVRGLGQTLPANVTLYEESPVTGFERKGDGFSIELADGVVHADRLVLAAGVFLSRFGVGRGRYVPMATYASLTAPLSDEELAQLGTGKPFGMLGASEFGATIRLTNDRRLFVRNTFKHEPGAPTSAQKVQDISALHRQSMLARWRGLESTRFEHSWGGIMAFTWNDGAIFGEVESGVFAVLTNDVSPMTRGTAAGRLLADLMEGRDSDLLRLQLSFPKASLLPPRPFLDLGIAYTRMKLKLAAGREY